MQKSEIYSKILSKDFKDNLLPEAIVILSGGTEYSKELGYYSPDYDEPDFTGLASGSIYRIEAVAEVGKYFPDIIFVTTGKMISHGNPEKEHFPNDARVLADELLDRGISENRIILEEKSVSTLSELVEMIKISRKKGWHQISIMTNRWHAPRVKLMYEKLETIEGLCNEEEAAKIREFKNSGVEVKVIAAEDITDNINSGYRDEMKEIEQRDSYKERLESEQKGIEDLKAGRYKARR